MILKTELGRVSKKILGIRFGSGTRWALITTLQQYELYSNMLGGNSPLGVVSETQVLWARPSVITMLSIFNHFRTSYQRPITIAAPHKQSLLIWFPAAFCIMAILYNNQYNDWSNLYHDVDIMITSRRRTSLLTVSPVGTEMSSPNLIKEQRNLDWWHLFKLFSWHLWFLFSANSGFKVGGERLNWNWNSLLGFSVNSENF